MCIPVESRGGIRFPEAKVIDVGYPTWCHVGTKLLFSQRTDSALNQETVPLSFHIYLCFISTRYQFQCNYFKYSMSESQWEEEGFLFVCFWKGKVSDNQFGIGSSIHRIFVWCATGRDIWLFASWFLLEAGLEFRPLSSISGSFRTPHHLSWMASLLDWRSARFSCGGPE